MNSKKALLIVILAFVLLLGGAYVLYNHLGQGLAPEQMAAYETPQAATEPEATEAAGETEPEAVLAPDFTVYDKDGGEVLLSDFTGKPVVLNFWASWCVPCQSEMPDFQEKYAELGDEVSFVMVNMTDGSRETVEIASAFIEEQGFDFPVFYDTASDAAATYSVYSLPTSYFISADGYLIAQAIGAIDGETLQTGIDMIVN